MIYRSQTFKKLFNLCHFSLCNAVEQIFEILKRRFRILHSASEYSMQSQMHLIYTLITIHNYIEREAELKTLETELDTEKLESEINENQKTTREESTSTEMNRLQKKMTERM